MAVKVVFLRVDGGVFPVAVETGFTDADNLRMPRELFDLIPVPRLDFVGVVGVNADNCREAVVAICEEHDGAAGGGIDPNREHSYDSGRAMRGA